MKGIHGFCWISTRRNLSLIGAISLDSGHIGGLVLSCLALGVAIACDDPPAKDHNAPVDFSGAVTRVVDGDSLYLQGLETQIRLFGVDAPERGKMGFHEAKATLTQLVRKDRLTCTQIDEDRFKRIVARCFFSDGKEVNRLMIESGTVLEYCRFSKGLYGQC